MVDAVDKREYKAYKDEVTGAFVRTFSTDDGKVVLEELRRAFVDLNICGKNEYETITRAAKRDVVNHILTILHGADNE
jgi:hypothetical protein